MAGSHPRLSGNSALSFLPAGQMANQFQSVNKNVETFGQQAVPNRMRTDIRCDSAPRLSSTAFGSLHSLIRRFLTYHDYTYRAS